MKNKINIDNLEKRSPFTVPEDYFTTLNYTIMDKVDEKEEISILKWLNIKTLAPSLTIASLLLFAFFYNSQEALLNNDDLIEVLAYYDIEEELFYDYVEFDNKTFEDDYFIEEYDYNELINEL